MGHSNGGFMSHRMACEHPEQIVVVSGHLDSWDLGRGAIDDGAGVVISMATAEVLQRLHIRPRRTLRVIAWMDEENGGGGHAAYAKSHAAEMTNHIAAIESDAGAAHPLGFSAKLSPAAVAALRPILEVLRPIGASVVRPTNVSPGSDIDPLVEAGVPVVPGMRERGAGWILNITSRSACGCRMLRLLPVPV